MSDHDPKGYTLPDGPETRRVLVTITAEYEIQMTDPFFANTYPGATSAEQAVEIDQKEVSSPTLTVLNDVIHWFNPDTIQIDLELLPPEKP